MNMTHFYWIIILYIFFILLHHYLGYCKSAWKIKNVTYSAKGERPKVQGASGNSAKFSLENRGNTVYCFFKWSNQVIP